jgi:hypothetical protein
VLILSRRDRPVRLDPSGAANRYGPMFLGSSVVPMIGLAFIILYAVRSPSPAEVTSFGVLVALSALVIGVLIGFVTGQVPDDGLGSVRPQMASRDVPG